MSESYFIGQKGAQSVYHAVRQAQRIGLPLNQYVTLNFSAGRRSPVEATAAFSELRRPRFDRWLNSSSKRRIKATWCYVFENCRDDRPFETMEPDGDHNVHLHWLVHVPPGRELSFQNWLEEWVPRVMHGFRSELHAAKAIRIRRIDGPTGLRGYVLKGTAPEWSNTYGADHRPQGIIVGGLRSGTSRNIGKTARRELDKSLGVTRRIPPRPDRGLRSSEKASCDPLRATKRYPLTS